jgi:hypothetical protein
MSNENREGSRIDPDEETQRADRFLIMLSNCLYNKCEIDKHWFVDQKRTIRATGNDQSQFLVKPKCCKSFKDGLWVSHSQLKQQNMTRLTDNFENNVLKESHDKDNKSNQINGSNETEDFCDRLLNELFMDSNNIQVRYDDFAWLMRHYDASHQFYMRELDSNLSGLENQFVY